MNQKQYIFIKKKLALQINSEEIEEKKLTDAFNQLNSCFKKNNNNKEEVLDRVLNFFKENYNYDVSILRAGYRNILTRSLTYIRLSDLNVNHALESIIANSRSNEEENHIHFNYLSQSGNSTETSNSNFSTLLSQNIEIKDEVLKIMIIGSSMVGKTLLLSSFLDYNFDEKSYVYFPTSGMEIKKIVLKLNEKNVRIEFYDTDTNIHQKDITNSIFNLIKPFIRYVMLSFILSTLSGVSRSSLSSLYTRML